VNEHTLQVLHGSVYQLRRSVAKLIDEQGKVMKEITLGKDTNTTEGGQKNVGKKQGEDGY
jgi:hypothetical protein